MTSALLFFGTIMIYWMHHIFRELLYYYANEGWGPYVEKSLKEFRIRVAVAGNIFAFELLQSFFG